MDHEKHKAAKEKENWMRKRFDRERRLRKIEELIGTPQKDYVRDKCLESLEEAKRKLTVFGVTESEYQAFADGVAIKVEFDELEAEACVRCKKWFRYYRQDDLRGWPPCADNQDCGPFCPDYEPATDEEINEFYHGQDI